MCGIVGILNFSPGQNREAVTHAANSIRHRGPDDFGVYEDSHICMAFRRLSIIDLEHGAQPMCNETGDIWVVYNGEIYNFATLKQALRQKGHTFKTRCDTEVILHQYEEQGDTCVKTFNGMFAFALWDKTKRRLLLARDRMGIKPLYYAQTNNGLAFASELKALLHLPGVHRTINPDALSAYLSFRYVPGPLTIFENIYKLSPGHFFTVENGIVNQPAPYWDMHFQPEQNAQIDEREYIHQFDMHLQKAVESHLVSDVPLGVLLSGGLDSTAMAVYMRDLGVTDLKTFSVAFDTGGEFDERPFARQAASAFQTDHKEITISSTDFVTMLDDFVWFADEPLADLASVPLFAVSKLAREHVTVVLSGEGSDELFGGYPGIERLVQRGEWLKHMQNIPVSVRRLGMGLASTFTSSSSAKNWLRAFAGPVHQMAQTLQLSMTGVFHAAEKQRLMPEVGHVNYHIHEQLLMALYNTQTIGEPLNQALYMYMKNWLPDDLLTKADRMTMAHSLELRVPFLDNDVVAFTATLPTHMKLHRNGKTWIHKYVLRKALEGRIPQTILTRPKQGFPVPAYHWLTTDLQTFARNTLLDRDNPANRFFAPTIVESLLTRSAQGDHQAQRQVWVLIIFVLWHRRYLP